MFHPIRRLPIRDCARYASSAAFLCLVVLSLGCRDGSAGPTAQSGSDERKPIVQVSVDSVWVHRIVALDDRADAPRFFWEPEFDVMTIYLFARGKVMPHVTDYRFNSNLRAKDSSGRVLTLMCMPWQLRADDDRLVLDQQRVFNDEETADEPAVHIPLSLSLPARSAKWVDLDATLVLKRPHVNSITAGFYVSQLPVRLHSQAIESRNCTATVEPLGGGGIALILTGATEGVYGAALLNASGAILDERYGSSNEIPEQPGRVFYVLNHLGNVGADGAVSVRIDFLVEDEIIEIPCRFERIALP